MMKASYKYIALALAALLCSCNEEITPDVNESQVQISADITPCILTRVTEDGKSFTDGDVIKVQNTDRENKNLATYTYSESTGKWSASEDLYWDGEAANTFNAWYPATAAYDSFTIPADQTSGTASADWMTATTSAKKADGAVNLSFNHNLAKVTVTIDSWSNEYADNEKVANSLELRSLSDVMSNDGGVSGDDVPKWVKAYIAQANISFVAIIAPGTYVSGDNIMQVYVNGSATPLAVKTSSALTLESGKAYSFKLTVGKDLAEITSDVTVDAWDDEALDDQLARPVIKQTIEYIDEYGINHGEGIEIDGIVWAPVNCGYHATDYKYGKLYQWGRKYGQGYDSNDASIPSIVRGPEDFYIVQQESNSNKFYSSMNSDFDWIYGGSNSRLWNSGTEEQPIKTEYDPCPDGWRIPTYNELNALKTNYSSWTTSNGQNGYWFSGRNSYSESVNSIFLSAAGNRLCGDGSASSRGNDGKYWSSSPNNNDTYYLSFYASNVLITYYHRASGYSVRCVQDKNSEEPSESQIVNLSNEGTANSYIVSEAGSYKFSTVKGNSSESVGVVASAEVLWETFGTDETPNVGDLVKNAVYSDGYITFQTADTFKEGNAVIAAKDASGTILWSWHIWLTDQPKDEIYDNHAGIMLDRNLGAGDSYDYGLYYQWGRKDPFLISTGSTITWPSWVESSASTGTVDYVTKNPTTYVQGVWSRDDDWHFSNRDNTLWGSEKTIYDPCPAGYRVPDASVWENAGMGGSANAMTWNDDGKVFFMEKCGPYYPYAGTFGQYKQGFWGYYWSVTPAAQYLWVYWDDDDDSHFGIGGIDGRGNAYSVRCMKEGTGDGFDLSTEGTANCYIVSDTGVYKFPTVKGNSRESVGKVASTEVLWESFGTSFTPEVGSLIKSTSYKDNYITFVVPEYYREGNAVIAAKDASGTILWSWHIWLTDKPKDQVYCNNAGTMMDRNLGATSANPGAIGALGLLYQWGRKDPFLGSSSITESIEAKSTIEVWTTLNSHSESGTIEYATKNPTTFLSYNTNNYDWYYTGNSTTDNTRWQSKKTIYDPCPAGYRVPDGGNNCIWNTSGFSSMTYDDTNKGISVSISASSNTWYPASGSLYASYGGLHGVGSAGEYWSVTPDGYYAHNLTFFMLSESIYPSESSSRATGYSVRCVKEVK